MRCTHWRWQPAGAIYVYDTPRRSRGYEMRGTSPRGGNFGVRRPLRYLRYQLDLDDSQTRRIAAVLNRLKLERDQSAIDEKRTVSALADLVDHGTPTLEETKAALDARITIAERMQTEVARAVREICEALDADQRSMFADLLRSGSISI